MRIVNTKELLLKAYHNGYAVPAINVDQTDTVTGVLRVCSELNAPVIIQIAPIQVKKRDMKYETIIDTIYALGKDFDVTVAIHMDHGTLEDIIEAKDAGFSSVMYDGSHLLLEKNIENTKKALQFAQYGTIEAELGIVGGTEGSSEQECAEDCYTSVAEAKKFLAETEVDFLAVAIGNAHGVYKSKPELNFGLLKELKECLDIPLVLHGASGIVEEDIKKAIRLGIAKINFFTDVDRAFLSGIIKNIENNPSNYTFDCFAAGRTEMEQKVREIVQMCGCMDKA